MEARIAWELVDSSLAVFESRNLYKEAWSGDAPVVAIRETWCQIWCWSEYGKNVGRKMEEEHEIDIKREDHDRLRINRKSGLPDGTIVIVHLSDTASLIGKNSKSCHGKALNSFCCEVRPATAAQWSDHAGIRMISASLTPWRETENQSQSPTCEVPAVPLVTVGLRARDCPYSHICMHFKPLVCIMDFAGARAPAGYMYPHLQ